MKVKPIAILKTSFFIAFLIQTSLCSLFLFGTLIGGDEKYGADYRDQAVYTAFLSLQYFPIIFIGTLVLVFFFYRLKGTLRSRNKPR